MEVEKRSIILLVYVISFSMALLCSSQPSGCGIKLNRIVLKLFCFFPTTEPLPLLLYATVQPHSASRDVFGQTDLDRILNNAPLHLILSALMV